MILEISVNLKRNFFEGEGVGLLDHSGPKWHWNAPFATTEAKKILGQVPHAPYKRIFPFAAHFTNTWIHHQARHYTFSDFFVKIDFDPWRYVWPFTFSLVKKLLTRALLEIRWDMIQKGRLCQKKNLGGGGTFNILLNEMPMYILKLCWTCTP